MLASSDSEKDTIVADAGAAGHAPPNRPPNSYRDSSALVVFALLLALRVVNASTLHTFFQPDEFFQSLEPAWQLAFGETSNAWITWEWKSQLRSSLHPRLFALVYRITAKLAGLCGLTLPNRAIVLLAAPKVTQAVFAALTDCYTWKLAEKAYGSGSRTALVSLALSVCSPWQWFCSTRTLSNCLETTLTSIALCYWPWQWSGTTKDSSAVAKGEPQIAAKHLGSIVEQVELSSAAPNYAYALCRLRLSLLLAALACVLRPTNALVWIAVFVPTIWQASNRLRCVLVREILLCGSAVLACSVGSDKLYYGVWTLPPLRFLYFNIAQSLAVFYGRNRPDYYFTEGLPLLLTTVTPLAAVALVVALLGKEIRHSPVHSSASIKSPVQEVVHDATQRRVLSRAAWASLVVVTALSLISHKEVRFLYPILPFLHVLAAAPVSNIRGSLSSKLVLASFILVNILIGGYASQFHQRGVIDVLHYLRHKHETRNGLDANPNHPIMNTTVGFLMPCHSTPWRSHLIYPEITAWALTCEPPLDIPLAGRSEYLDEADHFYVKPGPTRWLRDNMESLDTIIAHSSRSGRHWMMQDPKFKAKYRRAWPQNLVFFEQLEPTLMEYLVDTRYRECWRGFNSHFHDDWRRKGDVIVWCLDGQ